MSSNYSTIRQHEPLRAPSGWNAQEKRFVAQLEEILDDLYSRFGRLRMNDLGNELRGSIVKTSNGVEENRSAILQNAKEISQKVSKTTYSTGMAKKADKSEIPDISGLASKDEIPDLSGLEGRMEIAESTISQTAEEIKQTVKKTVYTQDMAKKADKSEIPDISGLASKDEIPDISGLESRISTAESEIIQQADSIKSKVSVTTYNAGMAKKADKSEIPDISGLASKDEIPDISGLASKEEIPDVSTFVESSELTQTVDDITAIFNQVGLGGAQTGITRIGMDGLTVNHSSIGGKTSMNADGFRLYDADGNVIGGLISLGGSVISAVQRLANAKATTFYVEVSPNIYGDGENGLEFYINNVNCGAITAQYLDDAIQGLHIRSNQGLYFSTPSRDVSLSQMYANGVNVHFSTSDPGGSEGDIWLQPV